MLAGYYNGLDWGTAGDIRKFLNAPQPILAETDRMHKLVLDSRFPAWSTNTNDEKPEHPLATLIEELKRCGYDWTGKVIKAAAASARLADAKVFAQAFDSGHLG